MKSTNIPITGKTLKFAAAAMAATTAAISSSGAAVVFIDLDENFVTDYSDANSSSSVGAGVTLNGMLTFEGIAVNNAGFAQIGYSGTLVGSVKFYTAPPFVGASVRAGTGSLQNRLQNAAADGQTVNGFFKVIFNHAEVNGGAATNGLIAISATNSRNSARVSLGDLFFDDQNTAATGSDIAAAAPVASEFSAIPEPSSVSLLALGAAGLLARRRRNAA